MPMGTLPSEFELKTLHSTIWLFKLKPVLVSKNPQLICSGIPAQTFFNCWQMMFVAVFLIINPQQLSLLLVIFLSTMKLVLAHRLKHGQMTS